MTTLGLPILQAVAFSSDIYKFIHPAYGDLDNIIEVFALGPVTGNQGLLGEVSNESRSFAPLQQPSQNRSQGSSLIPTIAPNCSLSLPALFGSLLFTLFRTKLHAFALQSL